MRNFAISLGIVFLLASAAGAQSNPSSSVPTSTSQSLSATSPLPGFALNAPLAVPEASSASAATAALPSGPLPSNPSAAGALPQGVHSVYQNYSFQIYGGYTFMRFYEVPSLTQNQNGFNMGAVYYYHAKFVGADGEFLATFGSAFGYSSPFT